MRVSKNVKCEMTNLSLNFNLQLLDGSDQFVEHAHQNSI